MRITVIDSHPDRGSYGEALARAYVDGAEAAGHEVRLFRLHDLKFDLILHGGFKTPPPLNLTSPPGGTRSAGASTSSSSRHAGGANRNARN